MNAPADLIRLTQFSHGGGCGCKIAPAVLSEILAKTPIRGLPKDLLVGIESSDDAAVYRLNDEQAIVATTDFFTPIVDDPHDFGRIAATNALSDVYAMGGKPIFALAIVGMPLDKMPVEVIQRIISGGESVCAQAGIPIAGGHSIDTLEPIYGLVALGLVHPKKVKRNDRARPGCEPARSRRERSAHASELSAASVRLSLRDRFPRPAKTDREPDVDGRNCEIPGRG